LFYSTYLDNPTNEAFIAGLARNDPKIEREFVLTFAYDGMAVIFTY